MSRIMSPLLFLLARATQTELAQQIQYLKAENEILRARLPQHIRTTPTERTKLLRFGKPLGSAIKDLITIVTPRTFMRWAHEETSHLLPRPLKRRRTPEQIRALVVRIARETGWGYTRILGELRKLYIRKVSRTTIKNILQAHSIEPAPDRGGTTWAEFVRQHADTLWGCDFFSKNVWTPLGLRQCHVLVLINIGSRRVHIVGITDRADHIWMAARARELIEFFRSQSALPTMVLHDRDPRFMDVFDAILNQAGAAMQPIAPASPNLNAYVERWIQSIKHECLNHFIVFGERHLRHLIDEYITYYHTVRPHQGLGNRPIEHLQLADEESNCEHARVICKSQLGGLLKHYHRQAA